jgi:hypothetical protein
MSADVEQAEKAVPQFHSMLNEGRFKDIYVATSGEFKKVATEADLLKLLDAVHRKLGTHRSKERQNWNVNYDTSGRLVTLVYSSDYSGGKAVETFVYRVKGDDASLVGYHVNSDAFLN